MKERKPVNYWNKPIEDLAIAHPPQDANSVSGYIRISRGNKIDYLHRKVWEHYYGAIPLGKQIDHINGVRTDCRLANLRLVDQVYNLRNSAIRSDNTSGITGVSFWATGNAWRASVTHHKTKKQISKTFSINKYGDNDAFNLACDSREDLIAKLNLEGAGYSERHGT